ncbi:MAG: helix-turn-helix domain-containing protein [Streptosporangiales bacterium]
MICDGLQVHKQYQSGGVPKILSQRYLPTSHTLCNAHYMSEQPSAGIVPPWELPDRMRRALRHAGVGPGQMADYLEVGRNTVSTWINGRIEPSPQTLRLWALRCGVSHQWLRHGTVPASGPDDGTSGVATIGSLLPFRRVARHVAPLTSLAQLGSTA